MSEVSSKILIGVDGGGSGCRAVVANAAMNVLGEAEGGPANVSSDFEAAVSEVRRVVLAAAGDLAEDACIHMGLAGVISGDVAERVKAEFDGWDVAVSDDRPTTLTGALGGADGYLGAIGTGSFLASLKGGDAEFVGGWGLAVSDQASGAWLGRMLLEETLLCVDGLVTHTELSRDVLGHFDGDANGIVEFSLRAEPADYAKFAPRIVEHALGGDALGERLLGEGLSYIERGLERLGWRAGDRLCLVGGLGETYGKRMSEEAAHGIVSAERSTVQGAVLLAQMRAGLA